MSAIMKMDKIEDRTDIKHFVLKGSMPMQFKDELMYMETLRHHLPQ